MNFDNWSAPRLRARVQELEEMLGDIDDAVDEFREENEHGTLFVVQEVVRELVSKKAQLSVLLNSAKNVPACLERYLGYVWLGWAIDANYNDDKGVVDELRAALAALAAPSSAPQFDDKTGFSSTKDLLEAAGILAGIPDPAPSAETDTCDICGAVFCNHGTNPATQPTPEDDWRDGVEPGMAAPLPPCNAVPSVPGPPSPPLRCRRCGHSRERHRRADHGCMDCDCGQLQTGECGG